MHKKFWVLFKNISPSVRCCIPIVCLYAYLVPYYGSSFCWNQKRTAQQQLKQSRLKEWTQSSLRVRRTDIWSTRTGRQRKIQKVVNWSVLSRFMLSPPTRVLFTVCWDHLSITTSSWALEGKLFIPHHWQVLEWPTLLISHSSDSCLLPSLIVHSRNCSIERCFCWEVCEIPERLNEWIKS